MSVTEQSVLDCSETCSFSVDRDKIPQVVGTDVDSMANVVAYNQSELEAGVLFQAANAFKKFAEIEITKTQQRLQAIDEDIKFASDELEKMEKELDRMLALSTGNSRKLRNLELEAENKMRHIDLLKARKQSLVSKLSHLQFSSEENHLASHFNTTPLIEKLQASHDCTSSPSTSHHSGNKRAITSGRQQVMHPVKKSRRSTTRLRATTRRVNEERCVDDASLKQFQSRLFHERKLGILQCELDRSAGVPTQDTPEDGLLDANFRVPGRIWSRLFDFQRAGVNWLWNMHMKKSGGILGDEMGLGKTIQVIAFLAGLHYSDYFQKTQSCFTAERDTPSPLSTLIVCPATVLQQWMREFYEWYPAMRVIILHATGSGYRKPASLVRTATHHPGTVLLTTYNTLVAYQDLLTASNTTWTYVILDEGHKIKNPEAEVTSAVKRFVTPHRIILSGSPVQNNLRELWSVFDFVCPSRLGPLPEFMQQFAIPITQGGYASASPLQVETAYRCACTLRDLLMPYLIRRTKSDVRIQLPSKSEQVLFCRLTRYQRELYEEFTESQMCKDLLNGKGNVFGALILLRKLCNHPDLVTGRPKDHFMSTDHTSTADAQDLDPMCIRRFGWSRFGCPLRSSKMIVVSSLLLTWSAQGHKVLVFSQSRRMLTLLERLVVALELSYLRMDGSTPVNQRASLIDQFSRSSESGQSDITVFLLTTRVGGLGINLTAASRVLIYDPDWNPTTDLQARERAWRIGQTKDVVIYRLLTCGTIEEKIYHRQIFKQFLTNRVLKNPRQQRFFKTNDLCELLSFDDTLGPGDDHDKCNGPLPETASYLKSEGFGHIIKENMPRRSRSNRFNSLFGKKQPCNMQRMDEDSGEESQAKQREACSSNQYQELQPDSSEDREKRLRLIARELSRRIAEGRLDQGPPPCFTEHHVKPRSVRKFGKGTRVDGRRILLVARRSTYDTGEVGKVQKSRSPNHSKAEYNAPPTSTETGKDDVFLDLLLSRTVTGIDRSSQLSVPERRPVADLEIQEEATRVADSALKAIQRVYHPLQDNTSLTNSYDSMETAVYQSAVNGIGKHLGPQRTKPIQQQSADHSLPTTSLHSADPVAGLSHVSHLLQHDSLIETLTHHDRMDSSFRDTEIRRLIKSSIDSLVSEARRCPPDISQLPVPAQSTSYTESPNPLLLNFASVRNRYLWNPKEENSIPFRYLSTSLAQSSLRRPVDGTLYVDTSVLSTGDASPLLTGHVRFSSTLLLQLIRTRCSVRRSSESFDTSSSTSLSMQRLCCELVRLLSGANLVTSTVLATSFRPILTRTSEVDGDHSVLTARHFRVLLRCVAERRRASGPSSLARHRINDVWTLKDSYSEVARYLSSHLASCER